MDLNGMLRLKLLIDLYFSKYNHDKMGTMRDIAHEIAEDTGHIRSTLSCFVKQGIFKSSMIEFKGKLVNAYLLDKEEYLKYLFSLEISKKYWMIMYDNRTILDDLYIPYEKEEFKKMKNYLTQINKGANIKFGGNDNGNEC